MVLSLDQLFCTKIILKEHGQVTKPIILVKICYSRSLDEVRTTRSYVVANSRVALSINIAEVLL